MKVEEEEEMQWKDGEYNDSENELRRWEKRIKGEVE
jgi:hypothetical protein